MYLRTKYDIACKSAMLHCGSHQSLYVELTFKCQSNNNININIIRGTLNALKLKADLLSNQNQHTIIVLQ
jgi:hypothetical protein